jgi:hypothetical protein
MSATCDPAELFNHFRPSEFWEVQNLPMPALKDVQLHIVNPMNEQWDVEEMFLEDLGSEDEYVKTAMRDFDPTNETIYPKLYDSLFPVLFSTLNRYGILSITYYK